MISGLHFQMFLFVMLLLRNAVIHCLLEIHATYICMSHIVNTDHCWSYLQSSSNSTSNVSSPLELKGDCQMMELLESKEEGVKKALDKFIKCLQPSKAVPKGIF